MDIVKDYVGVMSVEFQLYRHTEKSMIKEVPSLVNSSQLFSRGTTGRLASTREGEHPKSLGRRVMQIHTSDSRSVDASWGSRLVGRTEKE